MSRRESQVEEEEAIPPKLDWVSSLRKAHEKIAFDTLPESKVEEKVHLYNEEQDPVKQMVKRVMYAEGDTVEVRHECASYLKDALLSM